MPDSGLAMDLGECLVRDADLPRAQIDQPDEVDLTKPAIRELKAGEKNAAWATIPGLGNRIAVAQTVPGDPSGGPRKVQTHWTTARPSRITHEYLDIRFLRGMT